MRARFLLCLASVLLSANCAKNVAADESGREERQLVSGWRFALSGTLNERADIDDSTWQRVDLPHTWNRVGGYGAKPPGANEAKGTGWYRLHFEVGSTTNPSLENGRRTWLQFDGASVVADVWLNGVSLGRHDGAFSRFRFDVTDEVRPGQNLLAIRTDNTAPATPGAATAETIPMSGDWFMYGGLYRKVSLISTNAVHIDLADAGGSGVYVNTVSADDQKAQLAIVTKIRNDAAGESATRVRTALIDTKGTVVATATQELMLAAGTTGDVRTALDLTRPHLWNGVPDPYMYKLRTQVLFGDTLLDQVETNVGIRTIRIDPEHGFFLNGKKLVLHGVNRHQEVADKGWAASEADVEKDYELIAELGANTVRFAHYQHDQFEYELADRLGLIVWSELPFVNTPAPEGQPEATPALVANAELQLREMIRQNFNHPSIAVWSVANEPNLLVARMQQKARTLPLLERLVKLANAEDAYRPGVLASCCGTLPGDAAPGEHAEGLDSPPMAVNGFGVNTYFGWYYATAGDVGAYLDKVHEFYPTKALGVTEYGGGGALSQHSDYAEGGPIHAFSRPHPEEFQAYLHEQTWPQIKARPWLWGSWVWVMFDFGSAQRQEGDLVDTNDKGLVSYDRQTRKDSFYYYKAQWNPEPMLYLTGRRYLERASPVADVKAYSNASKARLTLNGKDLGWTECEARICLWRNIHLSQGDNRLVVEAMSDGKPLRDTVTWHRSDGPDTWRILAGQLTVTQTSAGLYGSDQFFTGGQAADLNPRGRGPAPPPKLIAGASDQALYAGYRSGSFSYELVLPNGDYLVTLRFAEPVTEQVAGKRVFDVLAQRKVLLNDLDIVAESGNALTAVERALPVNVADGRLRLDFVPSAGEAILASFSVVPQ